MERGTEYGLEQVYNVIDSRYRSRKPLIVTTNLTLDSLQIRWTPPMPGFMTAFGNVRPYPLYGRELPP